MLAIREVSRRSFILTQFFQVFTLGLEVLDVNDREPHFEPAQVIKHISEDAIVGTALTLDPAHDSDSPENGVKW